MSNWSEHIMTKEGFKIGLYSFSIANGLRYVGTTVIHETVKVNYIIPTRLKDLLDNPSLYVNDSNEEVFVWLNEAM